jgi:dihydrofolate reductase
LTAQEIRHKNNNLLLDNEEEGKHKTTAMPAQQTLTMIAAAAKNNALGKDNDLIWHISEDLKRFKRLTSGHAIIMGRKTFESMPKALPNRTNIILTKKKDYQPEGALVVNTVEEALALVEEDAQPFIIGGGEIYRLFMETCDRIELTRVHHDFDADVFFPSIDTSKWAIVNQEDILANGDQPYNYSYLTYEKK